MSQRREKKIRHTVGSLAAETALAENVRHGGK